MRRLRAALGACCVGLTLAATLIGAAAAPAAAAVIDPGPVRPLVFPVVGEVWFEDWFTAPRANGPHHAQDLMGDKMQPLVAVADGEITRMPLPEPAYGYLLELTADDGWVYRYLHINNDTPGTDDGAAPLDDVFGPGIEVGAHVVAGQLLAYLGDSGNAEDVGPHLHFEMEDPDGNVVNPYQSLLAAEHLDAPVEVPGLTATGGGATGSAPAGSAALPRLAGSDRIGTSVAVSQRAWPAGAAEAVLVRGDRYAEALPASVLAGTRDAPLLLVGDGGLATTVRSELSRLAPRRVTLVGSVPTAVEGDLRAQGYQVERIGGAGDAVGTAVAVAHAVGAGDGTVVLVNGDRFADGVSAAGLAASRGWPILLSGDRIIPQESVDAWRALGASRVVLVGGTAVLGDNILHFVPGGARLAGADRYATSVAVAEQIVAADRSVLGHVHLATGTAFPDSLTAGALAARTHGLVLLVDGSAAGADDETHAFLAARAGEVGEVEVLGGPAAVSAAAVQDLALSVRRG
ncbi:MAG: cell wall-binding repeat-containing protein [Acidimicrobiales bacterium]|nr:cell wall-binding repeat-containing protein [Acidimicrobiales bacterium]